MVNVSHQSSIAVEEKRKKRKEINKKEVYKKKKKQKKKKEGGNANKDRYNSSLKTMGMHRFIIFVITKLLLVKECNVDLLCQFKKVSVQKYNKLGFKGCE